MMAKMALALKFKQLGLSEEELSYVQNAYNAQSNHKSFQYLNRLAQNILPKMSTESFNTNLVLKKEVTDQLNKKAVFSHGLTTTMMVLETCEDCVINTNYSVEFCIAKLPLAIAMLHTKDLLETNGSDIVAIAEFVQKNLPQDVIEQVLVSQK